MLGRTDVGPSFGSCVEASARLRSDSVMRLLRRPIDRLRGVTDPAQLVRMGMQLGDGAFIAHSVYIDRGHPWLISIGDDSVIAQRVMIFTHDAAMTLQIGYAMIASVSIGARVYVGAGAIILPGTNVGDDCVIGAGAVVKGTFPPRSVITGSPARVVSDVDSLAKTHLAGVEVGPCWPAEGWNSYSGITPERRRTQQEALAGGVRGYMAERAEKKAVRRASNPSA